MSRMPHRFEPNKEKMRELIQYVSQSCTTQNNYGTFDDSVVSVFQIDTN